MKDKAVHPSLRLSFNNMKNPIKALTKINAFSCLQAMEHGYALA